MVRAMRLLYDYRASAALAMLMILVGIVLSYSVLYNNPGKGESRKALSIGGSREEFSIFCTGFKLAGKPVCKNYVVLALGVISSGNVSISSTMRFCKEVSYLVLRGININASGVFRIYSRSIYGPKIFVPVPGFYVVLYNVSARKPFYCNTSNIVSVYVSENGPRLRVLHRSLYLLVGVAGLALLVYLYASLSRLNPIGWSTGLALLPVFGFAFSSLYVFFANPLITRIRLVRLVKPSNDNDLVCVFASEFLDRLSPASHYISLNYFLLWFFLAMGISLLLWATPLEARLSAYEYLVEPRVSLLYFYKLATGTGLAVLAPITAFIVSASLSYPGLLSACPRATMGAIGAGILVLSLYALLVELVTAIIVLLTGRGSLSAIIVGVALILLFSVYRLRVLFFIASMWHFTYVALLGNLGALSHILRAYAELVSSILLLLVASYLVYTRREVVI